MLSFFSVKCCLMRQLILPHFQQFLCFDALMIAITSSLSLIFRFLLASTLARRSKTGLRSADSLLSIVFCLSLHSDHNFSAGVCLSSLTEVSLTLRLFFLEAGTLVLVNSWMHRCL